MDVQIACVCGKHEQDTVTLPDVLDFRRTLTVRQEIALAGLGGETTLAETTAVLIEAYLLHCIDGWTLADADGKPLPVTKANIREHLLTHFDEAEKVGDAADDLYTEKVVLPLLVRGLTSSPPTPTDTQTSPPSGPGTKPRKPSKRSSITNTPMAVTGPMAASPGGVSSSSLS